MTVYTNLQKPSGTSYTNQNSVGKQQYDQSDIEYDDALVFYDGYNPNQYTSVSKPTGGDGLWDSNSFPWLLTLPWQILESYTKIAKP